MPGDRTVDTLGSKLRQARERRGITLRHVANATKISITALEALERDDISRLPGGIFTRAFVRAYALQVGLDPEATVQEFIAQFPNDAAVTAGHPTSGRVEDYQTVQSDRQTAGAFLWLAMISLPLAAALLYFATSGRPTRTVAKPADERPAPAASQRAPAVPASREQPSAVEPPPSATSTTGTLTRTGAEPPIPARDGAAEAVQTLTIELAARRPCWVSATVDGQKTIDRLLRPGERQTIDVHREMVLTAGDASALALTLNGAEGRPLGRAGEVVTARFNLANFKRYVQPR